MEFPSHFRWLLIIVLAGLSFAWHKHQQRRFHGEMMRHSINARLSRRFLAATSDRAWQMLFLWGILLAVVVHYDRFLDRKESLVLAQQRQVLSLQAALEDAEREQTPDAAPPPNTGDAEDALDALKMRYEELFVNYYYLKRCNLLPPQAFHMMNSSLLYELSLADFPAGVRNSILQAARGTHDEMYLESPCDSQYTAPLLANVRDYLRHVASNVLD